MKQRITTRLEMYTLEKISSIRRSLIGTGYNKDSICRVIDECVKQADEKKVIKSLKEEK